MISKEQKQEIIAKYGGDEKNTGSTQAQIALLTARINDLQIHFKPILRTMPEPEGCCRWLDNADVF